MLAPQCHPDLSHSISETCCIGRQEHWNPAKIAPHINTAANVDEQTPQFPRSQLNWGNVVTAILTSLCVLLYGGQKLIPMNTQPFERQP